MDEEKTQPTLRDTIQASIAQHSEPLPEPVEAVSEPTELDQKPEPKPGRTAGRARDEHGKLLPGRAVKEATPEPPKAAETIPAIEPITAVPVVAPIPRPSSWKKEMWPVWDKLNTGVTLTPQESRQVAEYNAQRESQFATGVSTYKNIADTAKPLLDAVAPFQQDLDRHNIKAHDMVGRLMSAHRSLAMGSPTEKLQLFSKLAQDYGIPIQALYDQNAQTQYLATPHTPQPQQPQQPQNIEALIEKTLADREVKQTIESMARDTTKYPFFNYVRATMSQLLESGEAADLDDAYARALDAPEHGMLSTVQQSQQVQVTEQARLAQQQATVRAAKSNTISPRSATPAAAGVSKGPTSVRDALREAISVHAGGARV